MHTYTVRILSGGRTFKYRVKALTEQGARAKALEEGRKSGATNKAITAISVDMED